MQTKDTSRLRPRHCSGLGEVQHRWITGVHISHLPKESRSERHLTRTHVQRKAWPGSDGLPAPLVPEVAPPVAVRDLESIRGRHNGVLGVLRLRTKGVQSMMFPVSACLPRHPQQICDCLKLQFRYLCWPLRRSGSMQHFDTKPSLTKERTACTSDNSWNSSWRKVSQLCSEDNMSDKALQENIKHPRSVLQPPPRKVK